MSLLPEGWVGLLFVIPLGLCLGSFATAMIARIPAGKSWIVSSSKPERSACPQCGHVLGVADLVPLFSWLSLRGKCRYCGHAIGGRYPLTELATMLCAVVVYCGWGFSIPGIILLLAVPFIIAMLVIDLEHMILPDQLQVILYALGVFFVLLQSSSSNILDFNLSHLGQGLLSSLVYGGLAWALAKGGRILFKRDALGMGDVKFFAVAGLWLGLMSLPLFMLAGGILGVVLGLGWKYYAKQDVFPFGPALITSFFMLLLLRAPLFSDTLGPFLKAFPGLF